MSLQRLFIITRKTYQLNRLKYQGAILNVFMPGAYIEIDNFLANTEAEQTDEEIHQKNSWFKNAFLDPKRNLKEEIHQELERLVIPV